MIYRHIRGLREVKGWTQKHVANLLLVTQQAYSNYETGFHDVPSEILIHLAQIYDVSVDYLLDLTDDPRYYPRKKK